MSLFAISCSDQESKPQPFGNKEGHCGVCTRGCKYFYCSEYKHCLASQCAFIRELVYGSGADDLLSISVEKNTGRDLRETDIVVKGEGLEQKCT